LWIAPAGRTDYPNATFSEANERKILNSRDQRGANIARGRLEQIKEGSMEEWEAILTRKKVWSSVGNPPKKVRETSTPLYHRKHDRDIKKRHL